MVLCLIHEIAHDKLARLHLQLRKGFFVFPIQVREATILDKQFIKKVTFEMLNHQATKTQPSLCGTNKNYFRLSITKFYFRFQLIVNVNRSDRLANN